MASLSFSCFQTLFCRHCNAIPNFAPKPRTGFRILSRPGSDPASSSSDDDFGLISTAERSDGSVVFRFGNPKDVVVEKAESSSGQSKPRSEKRRRRSRETRVVSGGEVKGGGVSGSTVSSPKKTSKGRSTVSASASTLCTDDFAGKDASLEAEAIDRHVDGVTTGSVSSELDSGPIPFSDESNDTGQVDATNTSGDAPAAATSLDEETSPTTTLDKTRTTLPPETLSETLEGCVDADENETSSQLGHNVSSTNEEQVEVSEQEEEEEEEEMNNVEELPRVEETPNSDEISTRELVLSSGAVLLQHSSEGLAGAEDAYFVSSCQNWFGVADGVGQWSLEGMSSGLYVRELMENCERLISDSKGVSVADPREVLVRSVVETQSPGSSTILVAHFDGQAFHVSNIGDSGFMIIRDGYIAHQSSPAVHEFNFPFHVERGDDPSELIESYKIELDEGDVVVTATDGLFDNLYDQEIASFVSKSFKAGHEPRVIAESLASKAQEVAQKSSSRTPFSDAAQAAGYVGHSGGKLDDVAVIVSSVQTKPRS